MNMINKSKFYKLLGPIFLLLITLLVALNVSKADFSGAYQKTETLNIDQTALLSKDFLLISYKYSGFILEPSGNETSPSPSAASKYPPDLIPKIDALDNACEKSLGIDEDGSWKKSCDLLKAELESLVPASIIESIRAKRKESETLCKYASSPDATQNDIDKCNTAKQELRELAPSAEDPTPPPPNMSNEEKEKRIKAAVEACRGARGTVVTADDIDKCDRLKNASGDASKVEETITKEDASQLSQIQDAVSFALDPIRGTTKFFSTSTGDALRQFQLEWIAKESLARSSGSQDVSKKVRGLTMPLAAFILLASIFWQAIVIMITRRSQPLVDVVRGLFTFLFWSGIAIVGSQSALAISDSFALWIFNSVSGKESIFNDMADLMQGKKNVVGFVVDSLATLIISPFLCIAVWIIKFSFLFRDLSMIILSGILSLAAAGSLTNSTREWLFKILSWMLSLVAYKPAVALVYATATLLAKQGTQSGASIEQFMLGALAIFLSIFALPVLTRFFTWGTGQATGAGAAPALQTFSTQYAQYGYGKRN